MPERLRWLLCAALVCGTAWGAEPVEWPARPVRVILPNGPGSTTDLLGRVFITRLAERFGRQFVVDNRPGAGGTLAMEIGARAASDGYTLLAVPASVLVIAPHVYPRLAYDPLRDFAPVSTYVLAQTALCVHANLPVKTVREFLELVAAKPRALNMASAGVGSTSHLGGLLLASRAGFQANHVPYKGGGPSIAAVAQGEAHWTVPPLSAAMPQVKAGRMRCLATGGDRRSAVMPELPTLAESGVPAFRFYGWNGVVVPRGTPSAIVSRLNAAMGEALALPEVRRLYAELGEEPAHSSPQGFAKLIAEDYDAMNRLVKLANVKLE